MKGLGTAQAYMIFVNKTGVKLKENVLFSDKFKPKNTSHTPCSEPPKPLLVKE